MQEQYDDSYASHKSRTVRQPGVYTRSTSAGDTLKTLAENNNYKEQADINRQYNLNYSASESRVSPNNVPRIASTEKGVVPVFKATESILGRSVLKTKALPLPRPLGSSQSASKFSASVQGTRSGQLFSRSQRGPEEVKVQISPADLPGRYGSQVSPQRGDVSVKVQENSDTSFRNQVSSQDISRYNSSHSSQ